MIYYLKKEEKEEENITLLNMYFYIHLTSSFFKNFYLYINKKSHFKLCHISVSIKVHSNSLVNPLKLVAAAFVYAPAFSNPIQSPVLTS